MDSDTVLRLIQEYGYLVLIVFHFFERLGVPLPAGIATTLAYALGLSGKLDIFLVIIIATSIPAVFGIASYVWASRREKIKVLDSPKLKKMRDFFEHNEGMAIIVSQLQAPARSYIGFLAGHTHYNFKKFLTAQSAGMAIGLIEGLIFAAVIYKDIEDFEKSMNNLSKIGPLVIIILIIVYIFKRNHLSGKIFHYLKDKEHDFVVWLRHEE